MTQNVCPSCSEPLGLIRADDVQPGRMFRHQCGIILFVVSVSVPEIKVRVASTAELAPFAVK